MAVSQNLAVTQSSQDVVANTSQVHILWQSTQTGESWNGYKRTAKYYVSVNGGSEVEYSVSYTLPKGTTKTILDVTLTVNHKTDGTGSVAVRTWMDTDISAGVIQLTEILTLTTIPRATTPTLSSTSVDMGDSVTINLPRASSDFTHDLACSFAGGTYVPFKTDAEESYEWTVPDLAVAIPNAISGTLTIRCITKSGDTVIGTKYVTMTAKVPATVFPEITSLTLKEATDGVAAQFGAFVKGKSTLEVNIAAEGAKGSTIKSYSTIFQGMSYAGNSWVSAVLANSGTVSMTISITDSRGRTSTQAIVISGVLDYTAPVIDRLQVYRVNESGAEDQDGERMAVRLKYSVAPVGDKNTAKLVLEYKPSTGTVWTVLDTLTDLSAETLLVYGDNFSTDYQYDVRATLTDWFGSAPPYTATLLSGAVILDISADGKGISFGKTSERAGVEIGWIAMLSGGFRPILLPDGTDLDAVTTLNTYAGRAAKTAAYIHCPIEDDIPFTLEVLPAGHNGQLLHRITTCTIGAPKVIVRHLCDDVWGEWVAQ